MLKREMTQSDGILTDLPAYTVEDGLDPKREVLAEGGDFFF